MKILELFRTAPQGASASQEPAVVDDASLIQRRDELNAKVNRLSSWRDRTSLDARLRHERAVQEHEAAVEEQVSALELGDTAKAIVNTLGDTSAAIVGSITDLEATNSLAERLNPEIAKSGAELVEILRELETRRRHLLVSHAKSLFAESVDLSRRAAVCRAAGTGIHAWFRTQGDYLGLSALEASTRQTVAQVEAAKRDADDAQQHWFVRGAGDFARDLIEPSDLNAQTRQETE